MFKVDILAEVVKKMQNLNPELARHILSMDGYKNLTTEAKLRLIAERLSDIKDWVTDVESFFFRLYQTNHEESK